MGFRTEISEEVLIEVEYWEESEELDVVEEDDEEELEDRGSVCCASTSCRASSVSSALDCARYNSGILSAWYSGFIKLQYFFSPLQVIYLMHASLDMWSSMISLACIFESTSPSFGLV